MEISTRLHTRCSNDRTIAHVRLSDGYLLRCEGRAAVSPCVTAKTGNFIDVVVVPFVSPSVSYSGFFGTLVWLWSFVGFWRYSTLLGAIILRLRRSPRLALNIAGDVVIRAIRSRLTCFGF